MLYEVITSLYEGTKLIEELKNIPNKIDEILADTSNIEKVAEKYCKYNYFQYLGRGVSYPVALEGALKLKEISYLNAEGLPAGEIKHGPIALVDKETPVIFIIPKDSYNFV